MSHTWQPHMLVEEARNQGVFVCLFACVFVWLFVCLFVCVFVCLLGAGAGTGALFGVFLETRSGDSESLLGDLGSVLGVNVGSYLLAIRGDLRVF